MVIEKLFKEVTLKKSFKFVEPLLLLVIFTDSTAFLDTYTHILITLRRTD